MARLPQALGCLFLLCAAHAQDDGYYELSTLPWNGDWLSLTRDQMVHGEEYKGYPGPLPKLFYALGLDADHPAVDFELRFNVDRDAPTWYGQCDGLAAAAVTYPQPKALVVNGVKFFPAELKALLTGIHKDGIRQLQGGLGATGLSPQTMESLLFQYTARDFPIIFDVDISDEIWNFPVAAFSKSSTVVGDWTEVTVDVGYTATLLMDDYQGPPQLTFEPYTYKFLTANGSQYQWTGSSVANHPQLAWVPGLPYSTQLWQLFANRYYNNATLDDLAQQAIPPNAAQDRHEPNDTLEAATPLTQELLLGCLPPGDRDLFRLPVLAQEPLLLRITVYDGDSIQATVSHVTGQVIESYDLTRTVELDLTPAEDTELVISLSAHPEAGLTAFYQMVFPEDRGNIRPVVLPAGVPRWEVDVVNVLDEPNAVFDDSRRELAEFGSLSLGAVESQVRSLDQVIWVEKRETENAIDKRYAWDHKINLNAVVPHLTFRNDWDTELDLQASGTVDQLRVRVYSGIGVMIQEARLDLDEYGRFSGSLSPWLDQAAIRNGAWFELDAFGAQIDGSVVFSRDRLGDFVRIPLKSKPLNGEMVIFDLLNVDSGWNGLALVNTSGQENELMFRLRDGGGHIVTDGLMVLEPGEKVLTTVAGLVQGVDADCVLELFSQYNVEALTIRHAYAQGTTWGHRVLSYFSDGFTESFVHLGEKREGVTLVCFNPNQQNVHLLLEGYGVDGTLHGRFHTILGKALRPFETRTAPVTQILENGVDIVDLGAITHFRLTSAEMVYCMEVLETPGAVSKTTSRLIPIYEDP